jgi:hypothetical protein
MPLFAEGPTFVIGWETGVAIATAIAGAVTAAVRMLVSYHASKDEEHRKQVTSVVTTFAETNAQQHAECQKDKEVLVGVVQSFNKALGDMKESLAKRP